MILSKFNTPARRVVGALAVLLSLTLVGTAQAQTESVLIKRASPLRDGPGENARTLQALAVQTAVTRLGDRQGPWIKVRLAEGTTGWVHMFDIAAINSPAPGSGGTGALRTLSSFFGKGSAQAPAGNVSTSTVGIRGLGAEDLASATPNMAALAQADAAKVDAAQARQFAAMSSLSSRQVEPLPAPTPPPAASRQAAPEQYSR